MCLQPTSLAEASRWGIHAKMSAAGGGGGGVDVVREPRAGSCLVSATGPRKLPHVPLSSLTMCACHVFQNKKFQRRGEERFLPVF